MSDSGSTIGPRAKSSWWIASRDILFFIVVLFVIEACTPSARGLKVAKANPVVQQARTIGLMMFQYSNDHDGKYPDGKSSTEVFQKLLDEGYCADSAIFYFPLPGKTEPSSGKNLKLENVCFDVTSGVDSDSPDEIPIVFLTGYKVTYASGGSATPFFSFQPHPRTWLEVWNGVPKDIRSRGIAVCYKSNSATFVRTGTSSTSNGEVPNFIAPSLNAHGKTYRQITPDGPLP